VTAECSNVNRYVVLAEFLVREEHVDAFVALMRQHAGLSRTEPGCEAFEVNQDVNDGGKFVLYERYHDEAAYAAHRATAYYARFRELAPAMLVPLRGEIFHRRSVLRSVV